jgi:hypothetical protein
LNDKEDAMKKRERGWAALACLALSALPIQAAIAGDFTKLSKSGEEVLTDCTPQCKVTSLPGESGYTLVAARSAPLIYNDVTIGTAYEKVWRKQANPKVHIFGLRVVLNTNEWDSSGAAFNINDLFRQAKPGRKVSVAYFLDGATKPLYEAGRTIQGLNEYEEDEPERDNAWVDFRVDVNAAELEGPSSAKSPWLLMKTRAPDGIELNPFGLRVLNSDFEDFFDLVDLFTTSYQPVGIPPPDDDDDDEEEDDE